MEAITIDDMSLNTYEVLGFGGEGIVYKLDENTAMKKFYTAKRDTLPNKIKKLEILSRNLHSNLPQPLKLVFDQNHNMVGYTMTSPKENEKLNFKEMFKIYNNTLEIKVKYLLALSNVIKSINAQSIKIIDIKCDNIMLTENQDIQKSIIILDIDSFRVDKYSEDIYPYYYSRYFENPEIARKCEYADEINFGLFVLEQLTGKEIFPCKNYSENRKNLETIIAKMNVSKYVKEEFIQLFSDSQEKFFVDEALKELSTPDEKFIKLKIVA